MGKKIFIYLITMAVTLIVMGIWASVLNIFPQDVQAFLERSSGWIVLISLGMCILLSFDFEKFIKLRFVERVFSIIANSALFLMYAAYLTVDYGSISPHISAIGFNVSEILRSGLIIWLMTKLIDTK